MTKKTQSLRGITRMDYERAIGWLVRVYRDGKTHSKFFADSLHGGKLRAKSAAIGYRDEYEAANPRSPVPVPRQAISSRRVLASSRVRGVSETFHRTSSKRKLACFSVSYRLEGVRKTRRFYHHLFSSRRAALRAATQFRLDVERQMEREHRKLIRQWKRTRATSRRSR